MSNEVVPGSRDCLCVWPEECDGSGVLHCDDCGGTICICWCGGSMACPGCDYCDDIEE